MQILTLSKGKEKASKVLLVVLLITSRWKKSFSLVVENHERIA